MNSPRSWLRLLAPASGLVLLAAFGCSHEQKAPPAHPAPVAARVVTPRPPDPPPEAPSEAPLAQGKQEPAIYFDFDSSTLRSDAHSVLQKVASTLKARNAALEIDGNCDELGTIEYNLALGEERAKAAKSYLEHLGVPNAKVRTVSYGSERPKYPGHDDDAHAKNRRDDLIVR